MKRTALTLVFVALTLLLAFTLQARQLYRTLPQTDGVIRVAGTQAPIGIMRDEAAVPHIFAANQQDAWFGLGFVHAQDRMWQMDMSRRVVAGRVSELVGKSGLSMDRFVRTAGLYDAAARSLPSLSTETRGLLDAYTAGVNTAITQSRGELSPEFQLFGVEVAPWTPEDSLAVFKMLAVGLSGNMYGELRRLQLMTRLSQEQMNEFSPPYPGDEPVALPSLEELYEGLVQAEDKVTLSVPFEGPVEASNNWVVDGTRTKSGMPLLSNDPHLAFNAPGIWYLAHLSVGKGDDRRNIIGGSMAGVPAILTGRTDTIAWGVTNTGPDTQDLYLERINPDNPAQYQTPDGWADFEIREEKIKVRFGKDVTLKVRTTRHGPVLPQEMADMPFPSDGYVLALQWTALTVPDISVDAQVKPIDTGTWKEFNDAFRDFTGPMQNFVYADTDGNIGFVAPASVPVRGPDHQTMGLLPAPGWRAENDWQGLINYDELPRITNPSSGRIATANSKVTPEGYKPFITAEWSEPLRTRQIEKRLDAIPRHDVRSFQSMHLDNTSQIAQTLLPHLMATPAQSKSELKVLNLLDGWDGDMRPDGPEGLVYSVWAHSLSRALYADELGDLYENYTKIRPAFLTSVFQAIKILPIGATTVRHRQPRLAMTFLPQPSPARRQSSSKTMERLSRMKTGATTTRLSTPTRPSPPFPSCAALPISKPRLAVALSRRTRAITDTRARENSRTVTVPVTAASTISPT